MFKYPIFSQKLIINKYIYRMKRKVPSTERSRKLLSLSQKTLPNYQCHQAWIKLSWKRLRAHPADHLVQTSQSYQYHLQGRRHLRGRISRTFLCHQVRQISFSFIWHIQFHMEELLLEIIISIIPVFSS